MLHASVVGHELLQGHTPDSTYGMEHCFLSMGSSKPAYKQTAKKSDFPQSSSTSLLLLPLACRPLNIIALLLVVRPFLLLLVFLVFPVLRSPLALLMLLVLLLLMNPADVVLVVHRLVKHLKPPRQVMQPSHLPSRIMLFEAPLSDEEPDVTDEEESDRHHGEEERAEHVCDIEPFGPLALIWVARRATQRTLKGQEMWVADVCDESSAH